MTFAQWMHAVDMTVYRLAGCSVHDLVDCTFRSWFEDGVKPTTAARRALKASGW